MSPTTPFVGRTDELRTLEAALASAADGAPSAVEVVGPAGIGKSRLLAELRARADALGFVALSGAGAEFEQDLPFWVFVDALDEYVAGVDPRRLERLDPGVRAELSEVLPVPRRGERDAGARAA
jgi:predicted ATPase